MRRFPGLPSLLASALLIALALPVARGQSPRFQEVETDAPRGYTVLGFGDLDGDGFADAIAIPVAMINPPLTIWWNDGGGRFRRTQAIPPPATPGLAWGSRVAIVDLDGDGIAEIVTSAANALTVLKNQGGGNFLPAPSNLPVLPATLNAIFAMDVDGDSRPDLVLQTIGVVGGGVVADVYRNLGGLTFARIPGALPSSAFTLVGLAHFNAGSAMDMLGYQYLGGSAAVLQTFMNSGSGLFTAGRSLSLTTLQAFHTGDFDGDGITDFVISTAPASQLPVDTFVSIASGTIMPIATATMPWGGTVGAIDLTGDGVDEVVRYDTASAGTAFFAVGSSVPLAVYPRRSSPLFVDLDGDGRSDMLAKGTLGGGSTPDLHVLFNRGSGAFAEVTSGLPIGFTIYGPQHAIFGDLDGDGDPDVVMSYIPPGGSVTTFGVALNDGAGNWTVANPNILTPGSSLGGFHLGDFNGDGRLDLGLVAGGNAIVYLSQPSWNFTPVVTAVGVNALAQVVADFDGDGRADIATGDGVTGPTVTVLAGQANGTFTTLASLSTPPFSVSQMAAFDADGDGDVDLIVSSSSPFAFQLFINLGGGTFIPGRTFNPVNPPFSSFVAFGDVDGDGDPDLLLGQEIWLNDGFGNFTLGPAPALYPATTSGTLQLVDLDGDGMADMLGAAEWRRAIGGGAFQVVEIIPARPSTVAAWTFADVDGDGDIDLLDPRGFVRTNQTRHLGHGSLARPGRTATIELAGPPLTSWVLFASAARVPSRFVVPPWGNVYLDLAALVGVIPGTLDAAGTATISALVPTMPSLAGVTIYWQAAFPASQRLSPLEATTVLGF